MAFQQVEGLFNSAQNYANNAGTAANGFIIALGSALSGIVLPPMPVNTAAPPAPTPPTQVTITVPAVATEISNYEGGDTPEKPDVTVDRSGAPAQPAYATNVYVPGAAPPQPTFDGSLMDLTYWRPTVGAWTSPTPPTLLELSILPFEGVNTHEDFLSSIEKPKELTVTPPTQYTYVKESKYVSALIDAINNNIRARLNGDSALPPEVEEVIWSRGRSRETAIWAAAAAEVIHNAEARGFSLPTGALAAQTREALKAASVKTSEVNRDIMVKQAETAQANARHAIEQGIALESRLIEHANNMEQRTFDAAKYLAENMIEIYNARVGAYKAQMDLYTAGVTAYRGLIDAERAKVDAYQATVSAERAKADINQANVAVYSAQLQARETVVKAYAAEIEAMQAMLAADKLQVEIFGEQIKAYVATIGSETARVEVFKAKTDANKTLAESYRAEVEAYATGVQAQVATAKANAEIYDAVMRGHVSQVQAYAARVGAEAEMVRAEVQVAGLEVEAGKAQISQNIAQAQVNAEHFKAMVSLYESNKSLALQQAKIVGDQFFTMRSMIADQAKVGAQVNSQLAASAYGTIRASAGISGTSSDSTQWSYTGRTSNTSASPYS